MPPAPMADLEQSLADVTMAPYIVKAMALIGFRRLAGGNMFRHQIATMAILIDYKIVDPVLLKAAVIHDLFEDAAGMPGVTKKRSPHRSDGPAVYDLVMEVTRRLVGEPADKEEKSDFLLRIMTTGILEREAPEAGRSDQQHHRARLRSQGAVRPGYIEETRVGPAARRSGERRHVSRVVGSGG